MMLFKKLSQSEEVGYNNFLAMNFEYLEEIQSIIRVFCNHPISIFSIIFKIVDELQLGKSDI